MQKYLLFTLFIFISLIPFDALPTKHYGSDENDTMYILSQMSAVINSRSPDKIKNFFQYYTSENAKFLKKSYLLDIENQNIVKKQEVSQMDGEEYIKYWSKIVRAPDQYAFWIKQNSFKLSDQPGYAVVSASIQEIEIINSGNSKENLYVKIVVSTNCNFSFNIQSSIPIIGGASCVEKIVIQ